MQISTKHLNFSALALKVLTETKIKLAIKNIDKFLVVCMANLVFICVNLRTLPEGEAPTSAVIISKNQLGG
jgi:hypothetical protein